jgi:hypothetical protein
MEDAPQRVCGFLEYASRNGGWEDCFRIVDDDGMAFDLTQFKAFAGKEVEITVKPITAGGSVAGAGGPAAGCATCSYGTQTKANLDKAELECIALHDTVAGLESEVAALRAQLARAEADIALLRGDDGVGTATGSTNRGPTRRSL